MFGGTLPVNGELCGGETFEVELIDAVLRCSLQHRYDVHNPRSQVKRL
jgi:hypothetical protein